MLGRSCCSRWRPPSPTRAGLCECAPRQVRLEGHFGHRFAGLTANHPTRRRECGASIPCMVWTGGCLELGPGSQMPLSIEPQQGDSTQKPAHCPRSRQSSLALNGLPFPRSSQWIAFPARYSGTHSRAHCGHAPFFSLRHSEAQRAATGAEKEAAMEGGGPPPPGGPPAMDPKQLEEKARPCALHPALDDPVGGPCRAIGVMGGPSGRWGRGDRPHEVAAWCRSPPAHTRLPAGPQVAAAELQALCRQAQVRLRPGAEGGDAAGCALHCASRQAGPARRAAAPRAARQRGCGRAHSTTHL